MRVVAFTAGILVRRERIERLDFLRLTGDHNRIAYFGRDCACRIIQASRIVALPTEDQLAPSRAIE